MSSSSRFRRGLPAAKAGTSVIAALVFAALLGAVALSLNAFNSTSANTAALPAQANAAVAPATPSTSGTSQQAQSSACTSAIVSAYGSQQSPAFTKTYPLGTDESQFNYQCVGAVLKPGKTADSVQSDYMCVGQKGKLTNTGSNLKLTVSPSNSVAKGTCSTDVCDSSGCYSTEQFQGSSQTTSLSPVSATPTVSPDNNAPSATQPYYVANGDTWCDQNGNCLPAGSSCTGDGSAQTCATAAGQPITSSQTPGTPGATTGDTPNYNLPSSDPNSNVQCYNDDNGTQNCYPATQQDSNNLQAQGYTCTAETGGGSDSGGTDATCTKNTAAPPATCNGAISSSASCTAAPQTPPQAPPQTPPQAPPQAKPAQTTASPITSLLSGLVRGLTQQPCYTTSTQNSYGTSYTMVPQQVLQSNGTYATVYVQQPTTVANPYGTTQQPCGTQPLTQAQAPYGVGTNGVACPAPAQIQQCPTGQNAEPISATGNGCTTGYQCVPSSAATNSTITTPPTAQLSCSPQVADVGQSVAISYSCGNATGSSGSGFSTNNQVSGTASSSITAPPAGTNTANFALTCNNSGQSANAQCSVQVNAPAIDFVANPSAVQLGSTATIGWVTAGMQSCVVSSPQDASFTSANASSNSPNGAVQTDPITQQTEYDLTCQTLGGQTKSASATITIATSSAATQTQDITVSSSADGATVNHGSQVTITWSDPNAASGSAIAIWLVDINSQEATAVIAGAQAAGGSYVWNIPNPSDSCNPDSYAPCASNLVAGRSYGIEATLYTPQNAYLGVPSQAPANAVAPTYTDFGYTPNPFTIGQ